MRGQTVMYKVPRDIIEESELSDLINNLEIGFDILEKEEPFEDRTELVAILVRLAKEIKGLKDV